LGRSAGRVAAIHAQLEDLPSGADPPRPISVTFIPAKVSDNPALLRVNPDYLVWLQSLPLLERERLLLGNWKIRPAAGLYFKREWCAVVDEIPTHLDVVRYWDLAATEKTALNDPDWLSRAQRRAVSTTALPSASRATATGPT